MNNITSHLMELDPTLVQHNEGEWNGGVSNYTAFNSGGVECEVGEFLYSLIRMMKPEMVLETGTHMAVGASYMGMALKDNGGGHLDTMELLDPHFITATQRLAKMGLNEYVTCSHMSSFEFDPRNLKYQIVLLDTEPDIRFAEFLKYYPSVDEGGMIFIHDLGRKLQQMEIPGQDFAWPFGLLPEGIKELIRNGSIRPFHFQTPRGLSGFYKVHKEDYAL